MAGGSERAVYLALAANAIVMVAKFGAFVMTKSPAMLSEGIHSLADVGNQALLALGIRRSRAEATPEYPYGFARERFIWALISAVGIFFLGCGVTVHHGITALLHPHSYEGSVTVLVVVLVFSLVIEGGALLLAIKAIRHEAGDVPLLKYLKESSDPMAAAVMLEDSAAVLGVLIASVCVGLSVWTGDPTYDAIGSILIGLMLGVVAVLLVKRNRELLLGEAPDPELVRSVSRLLVEQPEVENIRDVKAVVLGSGKVRFKAEVDFDGSVLARQQLDDLDIPTLHEGLSGPEELQALLQDFGESMVEAVGDAIDRIEDKVVAAAPELVHVDLEAD